MAYEMNNVDTKYSLFLNLCFLQPLHKCPWSVQDNITLRAFKIMWKKVW